MGHFYLMIRTVHLHLLVIFNTQVYESVICQVTDNHGGLDPVLTVLIYTTIERLYTCLPNLQKREEDLFLGRDGKRWFELLRRKTSGAGYEYSLYYIELISRVGFDDH